MKNLKNLIFGIGISGIIGSCSINRDLSVDHSRYYYDSAIEGKGVIFREEGRKIGRRYMEDNNILIISNPKDNKHVIYEDFIGDDLKIEFVTIYENGNMTKYSVPPAKECGNDTLNEYQKQFNNYLQKINDSKMILK